MNKDQAKRQWEQAASDVSYYNATDSMDDWNREREARKDAYRKLAEAAEHLTAEEIAQLKAGANYLL